MIIKTEIFALASTRLLSVTLDPRFVDWSQVRIFLGEKIDLRCDLTTKINFIDRLLTHHLNRTFL